MRNQGQELVGFRFFNYIYGIKDIHLTMNKRIWPLSALLLGLISLTFSCKKPDPPVEWTDPDSAYYPLQVGKYVVYNVDSVIWNDELCVEVVKKYQIKHIISDTFTNEEGQFSYRIETKIRERVQDSWEPHDVIYVSRRGNNLEWVHQDLRFIKMSFPVENQRNWKGNAYIPAAQDARLWYFDDWDYRYERVGESFNAGEVVYDETVTVRQVDRVWNDPETLPLDSAARTYGQEVFARGVGMVYREYYHWIYNPKSEANQNPFNLDRCREGNGVIMRAVDHN